jgi:hypothetical protein
MVDLTMRSRALAIGLTVAVFPKGTMEKLWFGRLLTNRIGLSTSLAAAATSSAVDYIIDEITTDKDEASKRKLMISLPVSVLVTGLTAPTIPYALAFGGAAYLLQRIFHRIIATEDVQKILNTRV